MGWTITTAGTCETFALLLQDPAQPLGSVFYFGTVGPVYLTQDKKDLDAYACSFVQPPATCPITWADAPVVSPFTPAGFMTAWPAIASMSAAGKFMPAIPHLEGLKPASTTSRSAMVQGGETAELRGLFQRDGAVGEGMFLATVTPFMPGLGYGNFVCGITAPKANFAGKASLLVQSLNSFTVAQEYVNACLQASAAAWGAVAEAGRTLSEASDMLWDGWVARTHSEDILAEQYNDGFLGVERVYDPATGTVYQVPAGWYRDTYLPNQGTYDMSGLQELPADAWALWTAATQDGSAIH